jgi:hypothetical protein
MSKGNWRLYAAFGLIVAIIGGGVLGNKWNKERDGHTAETNQPVSEGELAIVVALPAPNEAENTEGEQNQKDDYNERSVRAAEKSADWTMVTAIIGGFGTVLVGASLIFSAQAAKAALEAVRVTREVAQDQSRAYLAAEKAELLWGTDKGELPKIILHLRNTGQTPAKWFELRTVTTTRELNADGSVASPPTFSEFELSSRRNPRWAGAPANEVITREVLSPSEREMVSSIYLVKTAIIVAGTIRYKTFFDEIFESDFLFVCRQLRPYFAEYTATPDHPEIEGTVKEVPIKLQKVSSDLRSYQKIK